MLLQRFGARAWLTRIMFTRGAAAMAMAFVRGETSFYVLHFVLGAAEAGFFPGIIYYFTQWLPSTERGKAMAIFLSGSAIASVISGPVSGALLNVSGFSLHGWQWMFLIEGFASIVLCGFVWFWLQSHPRDAKWLSAEEKTALIGAITLEQQAREAALTVKPSMFKLLADKQIALFCFIYFSIALINSIGNLGGFVAPTAFGFLEQTTGSIEGGLYGLAATSLVAAVVIFFARPTPRGETFSPQADKPAENVTKNVTQKTSIRHQALSLGPQELGKLHDQYLSCGIRQRDDVKQMQRYKSDWKAVKPRF